MVQRTEGVSHWEFWKLHFQDNDLTNAVSWWWRPKESLKSSMLWIKTQSSQRPSQKGSRDWGTHSPWWGHLLIWILPESNIHLFYPHVGSYSWCHHGWDPHGNTVVPRGILCRNTVPEDPAEVVDFWGTSLSGSQAWQAPSYSSSAVSTDSLRSLVLKNTKK